MVEELPVHQRRDVEVALIGQIERELQTGYDVTLGRGEIVILCLGIHADFERNVVQRAHAKGVGVEDFVPAEGRAEQAVEFGRTGAICRREGTSKSAKLDSAGIGTGVGGIL